jgi:peroxiredoxin
VQAPEFTVMALDGQKISLSALKGKRVVLDFWATWCPPCVKEIPHFVRLQNETSREDIVILGISSENEAKLRPFVTKHKVNYLIASAQGLPAPFSAIQSIPTTFFIDRRGIIQSVLVGYHEFNDLKEEALQSDHVGEPKPPPTSATTNAFYF